MDTGDKPKFIRQPDNYSCGPTAIANALLFFGQQDVSIKNIKKLCKTKKSVGTQIKDFEKGLRAAFREIARIRKISKDKYRKGIRAMLDGGCLVVLQCDEVTNNGHYALFFMKDVITMYAVNDGYHLTMEKELWEMKEILTDRRAGVWAIDKI